MASIIIPRLTPFYKGKHMTTKSFKDLKKGKGIRSMSDALESTGGKSYKDERIWTPKKDPAGNYTGIIRFLPAPQGEDSPVVRRYNHGFKVNGKWFIENCPTTIGLDCPVCEANSELWNNGTDADKKIVSQRKRKESFYANILVIKDPSAPENEGQRFLFRFGKKIMEKIAAAAEGDPSLGVEGVAVEDFWNGADFILKIRQNGEWPTYEDSSFKSPSPLFDGDDEALEALWNTLYSLQAEVDPSLFKDYETLEKAFQKIVYGRNAPAMQASQINTESFNTTTSTPSTPSPGPSLSEEVEMSSDGEGGEPSNSAMDYFKQLSEDS